MNKFFSLIFSMVIWYYLAHGVYYYQTNLENKVFLAIPQRSLVKCICSKNIYARVQNALTKDLQNNLLSIKYIKS
jgi:hypothetical protein